MIKTNISRNYVESWGVVEALREVIQENLDARKKYGCVGKVAYKKGYLVAEDGGPGLQRQDLALGISGKRDDGNLIGQFGEGLKLASLVAARENRKMYIETAGFTVIPCLEYEPALECYVLALNLLNNNRTAGTRIALQATEEEYHSAVGMFLELNGKSHKRITDKIRFPGGRVYINGALATERKDLLFTYNLTGKNARTAQNRDRTVVDEEMLLKEVTDALSTCRKQEIIEILFQNMGASFTALESRAYLNPPDKDLPVWKRALRKVFGPRVCFTSEPVHDLEAKEKGFVVLNRVPWRWEDCLRRLGVKTSCDIAAKKTVARRVALKYLTPEEVKNLRWAKRVAKRTFCVELPKVRIVSEIQPDGAEEVRGRYDRGNGVIYLSRKILPYPNDLLEVLTHEMMHCVTGASDCTREFERGWQRLVVRILLKKYRPPEN